jgi:DNA-binding transcriptional regulator YiaG
VKNPSDVPGAREILKEVRRQLLAQLDEIDRALEKMVRSSPDKKTRVRHGPPTPTQIARVKALRKLTDMSEQQIAVEVGLNAGRVSEIVKGLR